jgi:RNA polymerase sigma-70 factor (ECF subfamily)
VITRLTRRGESDPPAATAPDRVRELVLPHLDAAYNLARWLTGTEQDAGDVVHEAFLRALRYADSYAGGNPRAWWLAIVRTGCFRWLAQQRRFQDLSFDDIDDRAAAEAASAVAPPAVDPETAAHQSECGHLLADLIALLPAEFREVVVLREMEGYRYSEIAEIVGVPIGTVMSRLARGRRLLRNGWAARGGHGGRLGV